MNCRDVPCDRGADTNSRGIIKFVVKHGAGCQVSAQADTAYPSIDKSIDKSAAEDWDQPSSAGAAKNSQDDKRG